MQVSLNEKIIENESNNTISVFDFINYRDFLRAYYHDQKQKNPFFSFRYFALKAKINSSGFYKNVMDGKRSLGRSLIFKFTTTLHLTPKEAEYFENMVYQNDAKSEGEKNVYLNRMRELRKNNESRLPVVNDLWNQEAKF